MRDWILCRLKAALLLTLFSLPIAAALWHQHEIARLEAITRLAQEPILPTFADADDSHDSDAP